MDKEVTTARGGMFRVEDVTFHKARKQSEVAKELGMKNDVDTQEVKIPSSQTPEQLIRFYDEKAQNTSNTQEKVVYAVTKKYLQDYLELKQKVLKYQTQEFLETQNNKEDEGTEVEE